ncbi:MAG: hypothetical protein II982_02410 [Clostridia bacterium]|nr:hypothetical protein [Clostridia bacterium]
MENRTLAQLPDFTLSSYFDGTFKTQFEKYIADQFPFRDELLKAYKKLTVKKSSIPGTEFKQIIEGEDGYNYYIYDENQILKVYASKKKSEDALAWADKINEVASLCEEQDITFMLNFVPSKSESLNDMLPEGADNKDSVLTDIIYDNIAENVKIIDTMGDFEKIPLADKAEMYYHTDHHWNALGSYQGLEIMCQYLRKFGFDANVDDFKVYPIEQDYMVGSYNRALGDIYPSTEKLEYYMPDDLSVFEGLVAQNKWGVINLSDLYATKQIGDNVSYATLYMNDIDFLSLHNDNAQNDESICVIKDSFFDALVPQLSLIYKDVYVVDTRYYKDFVLEEFVGKYDIDNLMLFYSTTALVKTDEMLTYYVWEK